MNIKPVPYSQAKKQFATSNPQEKAAFVQPLYDRLAYSTAGQLQLNFFSVQQGQGGKTYEDTNLTLAGQLPKGQEFLGLALEFDFISSLENATESTVVAALAAELVNDVNKVLNSAWFEIVILDKVWLRDSPLSKAPPTSRVVFSGAVAMNNAAPNCIQYQQANAVGNAYLLSGLWLDSSTSFGVNVYWPALVPISAAGKLRCTMRGINYRNVA